MNKLDILLPIDNKPNDVFRLATVTQFDPILVKIDGDEEPLAVSPITLIPVNVGDRVLLQIHGKTPIILGIMGTGQYLKILVGDGSDVEFWRSMTTGLYYCRNTSVSGLPAANGFVDILRRGADLVIRFTVRETGEVYSATIDSGSTVISWRRMISEYGDMTSVTRLHITSDQDVPSASGGSLTIGPRSGSHMQIDGNEILSQSGTSADQLILNLNGGRVTMGGSLQIQGNRVGGDNSASSVLLISRREDATDLSSAYIRLRSDSTSELVESMTVYNRPYTNPANMFVTSAGTIARSTSLAAFKEGIEDLPDNWSDGVLELRPRWWFDKTNIERYKQLIDREAAGEDIDWDSEDVEYPRRIIGFVAEEVAEVLPEAATYDQSGTLNGVAYDRIPAAIVQLVQRQQRQIEALVNGLASNGISIDLPY